MTRRVKRPRLKEEPGEDGTTSSQRAEEDAYWREQNSPSYFSTGCALLDCVLGGGWAQGRVANIVGDKSTGKTLLAIEAIANLSYHLGEPEVIARYAEIEAAFDLAYAHDLGMPITRVDFSEPMFTVEEFHDDVDTWTQQHNGTGLYVLDSLDALSTKVELDRDIDATNTMGTEKAKKMSEIFRKLNQKVSRANITLMVISQVRDNIGVTFGNQYTRSGGNALDFYASQVLWLANLGKIKRTTRGIERVVGVNVRARCTKNKVGLPHRECEFPILFGYGIDDMRANAQWLEKVDKDALLNLDLHGKSYKTKLDRIRERGGSEAAEIRASLDRSVRRLWKEVDKAVTPRHGKYSERGV